jgi:hypothetical protein
MNTFLDEYKENCRRHARLWPQRLARLAAAFVITAIVAPVCYLTDLMLGKTAALVVGLGLAGVLVAIYWVLASWWFGGRETESDSFATSYTPSSIAPSSSSATFPPPTSSENPFALASSAPRESLPPLVPLQPISSSGGKPLPARPPAASGSSVGTLLAIVLGGMAVVVLFCAGLVSVVFLSLDSAPAPPARPNRVPFAGPNRDPFGNLPAPPHGPLGGPQADPFANLPAPPVPVAGPNSDSFAHARQQQQDHLEQMRKRQQEIRDKMKRDRERMRERMSPRGGNPFGP